MTQLSIRLDEIGIQTGTDKSSAHHNYLVFYERFFEPLRNAPIKLLEIGVFEGASLKLWEAYFANAKIIGADINQDVIKFSSERTNIAIIDQSNIQDLVDLGTTHGPFDIIIDDGSHFWDHQITTLRTLFPFLRAGGYYIVEDLQTNFGKLGKRYKGAGSIRCTEYLKKLIDFRVGDEEVDIAREEDPFLRTYGRAIEFIVFARHVCLVQKKIISNPAAAFLTGPVNETVEDVSHLFKLLAHVGRVGDVNNPDRAYINIDEASENYIQGIQVYVAPELATQVEYRGRLSDGNWTDWVTGNQFAGSRGKGEDLTGVSVRLNGGLKLNYTIKTTGFFRGGAKGVSVGDGQDCVSESGTEPMRGIEITLTRKKVNVALANP